MRLPPVEARLPELGRSDPCARGVRRECGRGAAAAEASAPRTCERLAKQHGRRLPHALCVLVEQLRLEGGAEPERVHCGAELGGRGSLERGLVAQQQAEQMAQLLRRR